MTTDDIIRMAREAGLRIEFDPDMDGYEPTWFVLPDRGNTLTRFAKMVYEAGAAAEREACAKVCETQWATNEEKTAGFWFAAEIRARGQA